MKRLLLIVFVLNLVCVASNVQDSLVRVEHKFVRVSVHPSLPATLPATPEQVYGSGICIDPKCSVVATANHIRVAAGTKHLKVTGSTTSKVMSVATGNDRNLSLQDKRSPYSALNDVCFIYTNKPVRHKSGVSYSYDYHVGQRVTVAGYYKKTFTAEQAHIIGADALIQLGDSQLRDDLLLDISLKQGQSGSAVLDEYGHLIGMIILVGTLKANKDNPITASVALPVRTIAATLVELDPLLGTSLFEKISDSEPKPLVPTFNFEHNESAEDDSSVFLRLKADPSDAPDAVAELRARAGSSASLFTNFIAKQCLAEQNDKHTCYEVSVAEGEQIYREINGEGKLGKPMTRFSRSGHHIWNDSEWLYTLRETADDPWVFRGALDSQYLFTFISSAEDERCYYEEYLELLPVFSWRHLTWSGAVACFQQIITDIDFNVLSVFTELYLPHKCLTEFFQTIVYFDWVKLEGVTLPILAPTSEELIAKFPGEKDLRIARATWTQYRQYRSEHKIHIGKNIFSDLTAHGKGSQGNMLP